MLNRRVQSHDGDAHESSQAKRAPHNPNARLVPGGCGPLAWPHASCGRLGPASLRRSRNCALYSSAAACGQGKGKGGGHGSLHKASTGRPPRKTNGGTRPTRPTIAASTSFVTVER